MFFLLKGEGFTQKYEAKEKATRNILKVAFQLSRKPHLHTKEDGIFQRKAGKCKTVRARVHETWTWTRP